MRSLLVSLLVALLLAGTAPTARAYDVAQGQLRDDRGRGVQLRGINWFGFETELHAPHGLWARNWKELIGQLKAAGFNAVRLPLCPATLQGVPLDKGIDLSLNAELAGLDSLQLLDAIVRELDAEGMYVLLDHHRADCNAQSELWYTADFSERQWLADLLLLAKRYRDVPHVIGVDLMNEPHGPATWGSGDKTTDWDLAAARAGTAVLAVAPRWLLFVEGVGHTTDCASGEPHFWGENLEPETCVPLALPAGKVVLSPHVYGPDIADMPYFRAAGFPANLPAVWDAHFGRLALQGRAVVPGEFGGGYGHCAHASDRDWQNALARYLVTRGITSGFYWSLNPNSGQTGGLLRDGWQDFWPDKLAMLQHVFSGGRQPLPGPLADDAGSESCRNAQASPPPTPAPPGVTHPTGEAGALLLSPAERHGSRSCRRAEVRDEGGSPIAWRLRVPVEGAPADVEGATLQPADAGFAYAQGIASGKSANATLAPGERTQFRYCVETATPAGDTPRATSQPDVRASPVSAQPAPKMSPVPTTISKPSPATARAAAAAATNRLVPAAPESSKTGLAATNPIDDLAHRECAGEWRDSDLGVQTTIDSEWQAGYCSRTRVTNLAGHAATWQVSLKLCGTIEKSWNAKLVGHGPLVAATGEDYNATLATGATTDFGFCARK